MRISHIVTLAEDRALDRAADSNISLAVDLANAVADHGTGFTGTDAVSMATESNLVYLQSTSDDGTEHSGGSRAELHHAQGSSNSSSDGKKLHLEVGIG